MKKEDLVALGLDETQVNEVFKMRGLEIEASKEVVANLEAEKQAAEEAKVALEDKITELEENSITAEDLEAVKGEKAALETELAELTEKHEGELNEVRYKNSLTSKLKESGAHNTKALMALLNEEELKFEDGEIVGLDTQLEAVKAENDWLFKQASEPSKPQVATGSKGTGRTKVDPFKAAADRVIGR